MLNNLTPTTKTVVIVVGTVVAINVARYAAYRGAKALARKAEEMEAQKSN